MSLRDPIKGIAGCQRGGKGFKGAELYPEKKGQLRMYPIHFLHHCFIFFIVFATNSSHSVYMFAYLFIIYIPD